MRLELVEHTRVTAVGTVAMVVQVVHLLNLAAVVVLEVTQATGELVVQTLVQAPMVQAAVAVVAVDETMVVLAQQVAVV
jgi:hypothetical protein